MICFVLPIRRGNSLPIGITLHIFVKIITCNWETFGESPSVKRRYFVNYAVLQHMQQVSASLQIETCCLLLSDSIAYHYCRSFAWGRKQQSKTISIYYALEYQRHRLLSGLHHVVFIWCFQHGDLDPILPSIMQFSSGGREISAECADRSN